MSGLLDAAKCSVCRGARYFGPYPISARCSHCKGTGWEPREEEGDE